MRAAGVFLFGCSVFAAVCVAAPGPGQVDVPVGDGAKGIAPGAAARGGKEASIELRVDRKSIPPPVVYQFSRSVGPGRLVKAIDGKPGALVRTYAVRFHNGKPVSKELLEEKRIEPEPAVYHMGRAGFQASRGSYTRGRVLTMHATAYDPSAGRGRRATFRTATGRRAQYGVVAVDPKVIPLGTMVFVEGYGVALACDVGSAIKGNRIDLCVPTYAEAMRFGRRSVRVHILKG
jgi:3D (Asp-Asp-Asp) domain-containing protein